MSSILKALKKLEQEKAVRHNGNTDIAKGILRNVPKGKKRPGWLFPVSMAGAALVASLVTFALMAGFQPANRSAATDAKSQEAIKTPPVPARGPSAPMAESRDALRRIGNQSDRVVPKTMRTVKSPVPGKSPSAGIRSARPLPEAAWESPSLPSDAPSPPKAQESAAKAGPLMKPALGRSLLALTVTGIAWQKDSTDRIAIVNGTSVSEGVMVEGARVEEIFQDRVRFSFDKQTFDISLGRTGYGK